MSRRALRIMFVVLAVGLIGGTLAVLWHTRPRTSAYYTDGVSIRQPAPGAPIRDILWQPGVPLEGEAAEAGPINSTEQEYEPRYTEDGQTLFFVRGRAGVDRRDADSDASEGNGGGADIYVSHRRREAWSSPRPVEGINTPADELGPEPSADGRLLVFYSDRAGGLGGYDLWVSVRSAGAGEDPGAGWQAPVNLGPAVNSPFNDYGGALSHDGSTLYFSSNRPRPGDAPPDPGAWRATLREDLTKRTYDIYSASLTSAAFPGLPPTASAAESITGLNTASNEGACALSPFGDFLYFASDRTGGRGGFDLYRARLRPGADGPDEPENLGEAINTAASELDPALSMGGFGLTFSSNRPLPGAMGIAGGAAPDTSAPPDTTEPPDYNLYRSYAREVYREAQTTRAAMDWAALVPWLWLLILGLLLLLLLHFLKRFTQSSQYRKLSLLAKCLLASLFVHAVLLLLFTFWYVGGALEGVLRGGGSTKIALGLPSGGGGIVSQLRADLTSSPITTGVAPSLRFAESAATVNAQAAHFDAALAPAQRPQRTVEMAAPSDAPLPDQPSLRLVTSAPPDAPREPIDLLTPPSASPVATTEAAAPSSAALTRAPAVRTATGVPVASPSTSAPDFSPAAAPLSGVVTRSVAEAPAAADASAGASHRPAAPSAVPPLAQLPAGTDVPVPRVGPGASAATEPSASIGTPTVQAGLLAAPAPAARAEPGAQVRLPVAGGPVTAALATSSLETAGTLSESTDARPASGSGRSPALALGLPALAAADVATPSAQPASGGTSAGEAQPGVGALAAAPGTARPSLPTTSSGGQATSVRIAPGSGAGRTSPARTLADPAGPTLADARPGPTARVAPAPGLTGLRPIDAPDLALPTSGAVNASARAEAQAAPVAAAAGPRDSGSAAHPALPAAGAARAPGPATLDPRPSNPGPGTERSLAGPAGRPSDAPISAGGHGPRRAPDLAATPAPLAFDLAIPSEVAIEDNPYSQRAPEVRPTLVERLGGSPETEKSVDLALAWLARHQSADGRWDGDGFDKECGECDGHAPRNIKSDVALTGLAMLCFLGADHTHVKEGPYKDNVSRAVAWLLRQQSDSGDMRAGETMYSQGIGAIALAEAYGMTRDPALRNPIERAIAFIVEARDNSHDERQLGGWRYTPQQAGDTSVLGWQVMALASAKRAGIDVHEQSLRAAASWLDQVERSNRPGLYAYQPGQPPTPSMTAEGLFTQQLLHAMGVPVPERDDPGTLAAVEYISKTPPSWAARAGRGSSGAGGAPTYYWYYGTLALFQHQGEEWEEWNDALKRELLGHQRTQAEDTGAAGSWDPVDKYSRVGGRVYQTAICTLSLEVYYRYLPMYQAHPPAGTPPAGAAAPSP